MSPWNIFGISDTDLARGREPCCESIVWREHWYVSLRYCEFSLIHEMSGLGMGLLTFDWSQIIYIGSPLMVPWWAQVNALFGFVVFYWILAPILYYTNVRSPESL